MSIGVPREENSNDMLFLPPVRKPMSDNQRKEVIEALAGLLVDYWEQAGLDPSCMSNLRGNVPGCQFDQEVAQ